MTLAPNAGRDDPLACVPPFRGKLTDPRVGQTLDRLDVLRSEEHTSELQSQY